MRDSALGFHANAEPTVHLLFGRKSVTLQNEAIGLIVPPLSLSPERVAPTLVTCLLPVIFISYCEICVTRVLLEAR